MPALTAYLRDANAVTTLPTTARQLDSTAPAVETSLAATGDLNLATGVGYIQLPSRGGAATAYVGAIAAPNGNGWIWDATTLELQQILAGVWTPSFKLTVAVPAGDVMTGRILMRAYVRTAAGVYTQIGADMASTAANFTGAAQTIAPATMSGALTNFGAGDKLYVDVWLNTTVDNTAGNAGPNAVTIFENGGAAESLVTPGYQAQAGAQSAPTSNSPYLYAVGRSGNH